ncbi:hypothetical protein SAMN06296058_2646 [Pseudoxanthomonas indica]|uniref:Uncharacterized protein n=1 Tax=Pseudoxanthomonas indica TaxID=428993 RepID=A0A1T5LK26_9GAMM|nr:hypothetical protein GCM10007235_05220 [Pseudoxanthomonas indica]SKC76320.1 hypothetical protein SAMN06296058_2646 [Pseudoxanthomonas indica]
MGEMRKGSAILLGMYAGLTDRAWHHGFSFLIRVRDGDLELFIVRPIAPLVERELRVWLAQSAHPFVLTGAGISTASGILDHRDTNGQRKRMPPVTYQAFVGDPLTNARYWARSVIGYPCMAQSLPNARIAEER